MTWDCSSAFVFAMHKFIKCIWHWEQFWKYSVDLATRRDWKIKPSGASSMCMLDPNLVISVPADVSCNRHDDDHKVSLVVIDVSCNKHDDDHKVSLVVIDVSCNRHDDDHKVSLVVIDVSCNRHDDDHKVSLVVIDVSCNRHDDDHKVSLVVIDVSCNRHDDDHKVSLVVICFYSYRWNDLKCLSQDQLTWLNAGLILGLHPTNERPPYNNAVPHWLGANLEWVVCMFDEMFQTVGTPAGLGVGLWCPLHWYAASLWLSTGLYCLQ